MKDYYKILGVSPTATKDAIKQVYRTKAKLFHPDLNQSNPDAADKLAKVNEAYDIIGDDAKRKTYDQQVAQHKARLRAQSAPPPPPMQNMYGQSSHAGQSHQYQQSAFSQAAQQAAQQAAYQAQAAAAAQAAAQAQQRPYVGSQIPIEQLTANAYNNGYSKGFSDAAVKQKESERALSVQIKALESLMAAAQDERNRAESSIRTLEIRLREKDEKLNALDKEKEALLDLMDEQDQANVQHISQINYPNTQDKEKENRRTTEYILKISALEQDVIKAKAEAEDFKNRSAASEDIVFSNEIEINRLREENRLLEEKIVGLEQHIAARATNDSHEELVATRDKKIREVKKRIKATHYGTLGVLFWADNDEIKKAYDKLMARYNFKLGKGDSKSSQKIKEIEGAYKSIKSEALRNIYNKTIGITEQEVKDERKTAEEFESTEKTLLDQKAEDIFWAQVEELTFNAQTGDADAQNQLGELYYYGDEIDKDLPQAFYWFKEAAKLSHPEALFNLGRCYVNGEGTERDAIKGLGFIKQSAKMGCKQALDFNS